MSSETDIVEVVSALYKLLKPLDTQDRSKVVRAAFALFDETPALSGKPNATIDVTDEEGDDSSLNAKAKAWMARAELSSEDISNVFHFENGVAELIAASIPGKSVKMQVINAYMLTGLGKFFEKGDAKFTDGEARATCKTHGIFDHTNHSKYIKEKGNNISGSKSLGWTLTAPGLKASADLVRELCHK